MKTTPIHRFFCLLFTLFSFQALSATDYYWVGGTGNWSNFQFHWATTSGGSTFHTIPPTQNDDVYFDQNSFTGPNQTVTINVQYAYCRDIDWTGVQYNPTWAGDSEVNIYGSFTLAQDMLLDFTNVNTINFRFHATTPGHVIQTYAHTLAHPMGNCRVDFMGTGGEWTLQSDLNVGDPAMFGNGLYIQNGSFISDGYSLKANDMLLYTNTGNNIDLATSSLTAFSIWFQGSDSTVLDADSAFLFTNDLMIDMPGRYHVGEVSGEIIGPIGSQSVHFDDLELQSPNFGAQNISGNFVYHDRFHIADSGRTVTINGSHTILNQFTARTRPGFPIRINGGSNFIKDSGTLCFEWLYLENSTASGGANWYAGWQSSDLGGNNGWLFSSNDSCQALVAVQDPLAYQAQWLPNPVNASQQLKVEFVTESPGEVILAIYDIQGRRIWTDQNSLNSGNHRLAIPTGILSKGSYLGLIETPSGMHRQLLLVQ